MSWNSEEIFYSWWNSAGKFRGGPQGFKNFCLQKPPVIFRSSYQKLGSSRPEARLDRCVRVLCINVFGIPPDDAVSNIYLTAM